MTFNSKSITIKTDSISKLVIGAQNTWRYDVENTEKRAIALDILIGNNYNKHNDKIKSYKHYSIIKADIYRLISEMESIIE